MPCCHIPTPINPAFPPSLQPDAQRFARYVGGAPLGNGLNDVGAPVPITVLTSALHLEMKLWQPTPFRWHRNDAEWNSWKVMANRTTSRGLGRFNPEERRDVFKSLKFLFEFFTCNSLENPGCVLRDYDSWCLDTIITLRSEGLIRAGVAAWNPGAPPELGTVGLAQKLLNIYLKYEISWLIAGQWQANQLRFTMNMPRLLDLQFFLCALHAPIDRILLAGPQKKRNGPSVTDGIVNLPLGAWLIDNGFLKRNGDLKQASDGQFRPWSKLDCLRTYYGIQLILRRIAMSTWPQGCGCASFTKASIKHCADWFNKEHPCEQPCQGPDWVKEACELDESVIAQTIRQLSGGYGVENSTGEETGRPQDDSLLANGKLGIRESVTRPQKETPANAGSHPQKRVLFLNEQSSRGGLHNSALRIVAACDFKRNLGAICKKHHCLDAHQELLDLIAAAGGNFMQVSPQCRVAGICPPGNKPNGSTCCWGGSGYVVGVHFQTTEDAVRYLDQYFDVRGCRENKTWSDQRIQQVLDRL